MFHYLFSEHKKLVIFDYGKDQKKKVVKKKRAEHYEKPLEVNGSFIDIINAAVAPKKKN